LFRMDILSLNLANCSWYSMKMKWDRFAPRWLGFFEKDLVAPERRFAMVQSLVTINGFRLNFPQFESSQESNANSDSSGICWGWTGLITVWNARLMMRSLHSIVANGIQCKNCWNGHFEVVLPVNRLRPMEFRVRRVMILHHSKVSHSQSIDYPTMLIFFEADQPGPKCLEQLITTQIIN
jgi:hypothetical protein